MGQCHCSIDFSFQSETIISKHTLWHHQFPLAPKTRNWNGLNWDYSNTKWIQMLGWNSRSLVKCLQKKKQITKQTKSSPQFMWNPWINSGAIWLSLEVRWLVLMDLNVLSAMRPLLKCTYCWNAQYMLEIVPVQRNH